MFEVHENSEIDTQGLYETGEHLFESIQLKIHVSWYFIVYTKMHEDNEETIDNIFLLEIDHVKSFIEKNYTKVIDVYVVTPGHINRSTHWKMDLLKEIWTDGDLSNTPGITYVLKNGTEYAYTYSEKDKIKKVNLILTTQ